MRECCQKKENLKKIEDDGKGTYTEKCRVCGASHYNVVAQTGNLKFKGKSL